MQHFKETMKITVKLAKLKQQFVRANGVEPTTLHISTVDAVQVRRFGVKVEKGCNVMGMQVATIGGITKVEA